MADSIRNKALKSKALKSINIAFIIIIAVMLIQMAVHIVIVHRLKGVLIFDDTIKSYLLVMIAQALAYFLCRCIVSNLNDSKTTN